jgi:NADH-quinone oxidoreductase subunit L
VAIVQTDIKKVLAYSTISQLGYMMLGMGVGAWIGALFHLLTHAYFKALMFLGSGQVIEGCHHEQDIRNMGGLRKKMPVTCWTFFIGVIAIAGVGIPAVGIGVGGYFSKDEILAVAYERTYQWSETPRHEGVHASLAVHEVEPAKESPGPKSSIAAVVRRLPRWLFWFPIAIAYVTPFYMLRVWWLTFMGKPRNEHVYHHAHESKLMYVPLVALAVGTFFSSYFLFRPLIADAAATATDSAMVVALDGHAEHVASSMLAVSHATHGRLVPIVGLAFLGGFAVAYLIYRNGLAIARAIAGLPFVRYLYVALVEKLFFDHVYNFVLVKGTTRVLAGLSGWFDGGFDRSGALYGVIDRVFNLAAATVARAAFFTRDWLDVAGVDGAVNGLAASTENLGDMVRRPQTGRVRTYILLAAGTATVVVLCIVFSQEIRSFVSG